MAGHARELFDVRLGLCRRMVQHARHGTTDAADRVMFNDVSVYTDPQRLELEMQHLFLGMPQVVCLSSDLPQIGSYRLFDDTGVPIVVVRGKDQQVRSFLNVCAHRGARLVREAEGKANRFTCRFHGWSYDSLGHAVGIAQDKHFGCAIADHRHLIPCPAAERHGLVFVRAVPNSTMDIDAHLGAFGTELEKLDLDESRKVCEGELTVTCNWKYALDTYFENYHFAMLHKDTLGAILPERHAAL